MYPHPPFSNKSEKKMIQMEYFTLWNEYEFACMWYLTN